MHWIDPDSLPESTGTLERFICTPDGRIDGLVLATMDEPSTKLVHVPPHMSDELRSALQPGDRVAVRGVRPRHGEVIAAVAVTAPDGRTVINQGPPNKHGHNDKPDHHDGDSDTDAPEGQAGHGRAETYGRVRLALFAPKGELRGALLEDGTVVRVSPKHAPAWADRLRPGAAVAVRGEAFQFADGLVIEATELGATPGTLRPVKPPRHAA
jgi:hypothetical protein